jgi:hypothetical protein
MEAKVEQTVQHMDTLGWMVPDNKPSIQWSMKACPRPLIAVATTCGHPGIAEDVVGIPVQPSFHDVDGHGLDPKEAAIVDGVVHTVVDAALGESTGMSIADPMEAAIVDGVDHSIVEEVVGDSVVYYDVTERNRVAMSRHRHNVASRQYDGSRRCCYSGINQSP